MTSIAEWLGSIELGQYADRFAEEGLDLDVLHTLTDQDLKDLGVARMGDRRRLMLAIGQRSDAAAGRLGPGAASPDAKAPAAASLPAAREGAAERRQLTVMFCDLVGSTALAARLDPEDMREVVRAYQGACAQAIGRYEGFVAQYLGDGVMAYFGYPTAHEDDAERAVRAGLDLIAAVAALGERGYRAAKIEVRIGIATGLVVVGDLIGEHAAKERAVTGETPNLAARLQGLAAPGSVVVSAATRRLLGGQFDLRDLGGQPVKGLDAPVQAFVVEGVRSFESRFEARAGGLTGFIGREEECEHLLERWKLARQGRGQVVLVSGEAGIGKSRLTAWLADKLSGEPHTRLRYQCTPHHKDSALYPTIAQIERAAGFEPNEAAEAKLAKLEALLTLGETAAAETVPLFAALVAIPTGEKYPPLSMSPGQQRQRTLAALLDQVEALARQRPLLMVYEDAHWADATSLELLDALADRLARLPVLVVITGRPEFAPTWAGRHTVSTVTLQKLDRRHTRAMVESVAGGAALPAEVLDQIVAKTDGVPLFVEELTKTVLESGALVEEGRSLRATAALPIPATLQDSLMARLDRSNPVKEIAQIGAAIGREFSYGLLLAVAGLDEATVRAGLARLEEAELASRRGVPPDATYTFKHALVQETAYESLLKSRRLVVHRRIAKSLRDLFPLLAETEPEIVAHHFTQAGKAEQAIIWWRKAGDIASRRSAHIEAVSHYARAISHADTSPALTLTSKERLELQIKYGQSAMAGFGYGAIATSQAFTRARELAEIQSDGLLRSASYFGFWISSWCVENVQAMYEVSHASLEVNSGDCGKNIEKLAAYRMLGTVHQLMGEYKVAENYLSKALSFYDYNQANEVTKIFGQDLGTQARYYMSISLWKCGFLRKSQEFSDQALCGARSLNHPLTLASALATHGVLEAWKRHVENTRLIADELILLAEEHSMPFWLSWGLKLRYWTSYCYNSFHRHNDDLSRARAIDEKLIIKQTHFFSILLLGAIFKDDTLAILQELDRIECLLHEQKVGWLDEELNRHRGKFFMQIFKTRSDLAESALQKSILISRRRQARTHELCASLDLARLYCNIGREGDAVPLLQGALAGFTVTPELPEINEAQQLLASLG